MFAPIVIFAFNREHSLTRMFESLSKCPEFKESKVIIYVDGPRSDDERQKVEHVIEVAHRYSDDIHISETNQGLGPSIIMGVSDVLKEYGRAIVIEDDLILSPGFLSFMNMALDRYEDDKRICSVCGYGLKIKRPSKYNGDVYLSIRSSSWGWATWADRWDKIDWSVSDYQTFKSDKNSRRSFNKGGSDMSSMLDGYMSGRNRSWAIRFCYWQWRKGLYSVHPFRSLVENDGFGNNATNCKQKYSRFKTDFDNSGNLSWNMPLGLAINREILKENARYHSMRLRIYSKIRKLLNI